MTYLIILICLFIITAILHRAFRVRLYDGKKQAVTVIIVFFIIGVAWDTFAISRGHWLFPAGHHLGLTIGLMPVEEYLFMLVQPYFIITVYKIITSRHRATSADK